ncbi:AMP-binding protein [Campylobacter lari]|uniref:AMP-binding protein n=1 Tax=Campylobacter lari TaxID=201 RepID=UPI00215277FB|nr:AMP-binding protein [Campylobacter lari]MCR6538040.1 AMP-binding protein [Campylobacter lari]
MMNNVVWYLENSAKLHPEKIAFFTQNDSINYADLLDKSKRIASFLLHHKTKPNSIVAIYMNKNIDCIAMIFGCAMARVAYAFIDIDHPKNRIEKMLEIIEPKFIFTNTALFDDISKITNREIVDIAKVLNYEIQNDVLEKIQSQYESYDILDITFTSGSTGSPKAVVKTHSNVLYFVPVFVDEFKFSSDDIFANQAPLDFDISIKDIYSAVYLGASVFLIDKYLFTSPAKLVELLIQYKISILIWAVSALTLLSSFRVFKYCTPIGIKKVLFSGEVMPLNQLDIWQKNLPKTEFVNLYGPSEITCNCAFYKIKNDYCLKYKKLPIGNAFRGQKVFLLAFDNDGKPYEVKKKDEIGEICVSGPNVALGYYKDFKRTNEVFIQNPLNLKYYERIYKTGDMGKYNEQGELVFQGRNDFQIKHLGRRIELGDIEIATIGIKGIELACAIYECDKIYLFYSGVLSVDDLIQYLKNQLISYMLPSVFFKLENLPLNKNGKIDRAKLREMIYEK